jgi:hypothetical protein
MITKTLSTQFNRLVFKLVKIVVHFTLVVALFIVCQQPEVALGQQPSNWVILLSRLKVSDAQEESWLSDGDEPYFIMISFRSRFNTPNSTQVWSNRFDDDEWAEGVDDRAERNIPVTMGLTGFTNVQLVSLRNVRQGIMPEIVGTLVIAMESDSTPWRRIRGMVSDLQAAIEREVERLVEDGELNLLNPGADIGIAVQNIFDSVVPDFWDAVGLVVESVGDPDDLIGYHLFLFAAVDGSVPVNFPAIANVTSGRLTLQTFSLNNNPIRFRGNGATYDVAAQIGILDPHMFAFAPAAGRPDAVKKADKPVTSWGKIKAGR